jgi:hypothetical protein
MYNPVLYEADLTCYSMSHIRGKAYQDPNGGVDSPIFCASQMKNRFGATSENIHLKVSLEEFEGSKPVRISYGYCWTTSKKGRVNGSLYFVTQEALLKALRLREVDTTKIVTIYVKVDNLPS